MAGGRYRLVRRRQIQFLAHGKTVLVFKLVPLADFRQTAEVVVAFHTDSVKSLPILDYVADCIGGNLDRLGGLSGGRSGSAGGPGSASGRPGG